MAWPAVVAVGAVLLGVVRVPAPAGAAAPPLPVPTTPVLSLRRAPAFVVEAVADRRLATALQRIVDQPGGPPGQTCLSVSDPDGTTAFTSNATSPLIPASTMKLETATAALARLGPASHLTTQVKAAAPPAGGTVAGDLYLVGGGDPLLATADFAAVAGYQQQPRLATSVEALADKVVAAGVRRVEGRVVGDESRYDTQRYVPTWLPTYATEGEIGPMGALEVNGGFTAFRPRAIPAPAPATAAAATFTALLRARGVTVGGEAGEGTAPAPGAAVAALDSPALSDVVAVMLQESDNLTAELLVKELGFRFGGAGTTTAGLGVVRSTLASMGLSGTGTASVDGSGLDRSDRLTCDALQAILLRSGENGDVGKGMAVAGRNGTLAKRFTGTPAAGRVRAKTGSLQGVNALTGWISAPDGRLLQFALLANGLPTESAGTGLEDRVVTALAAWPQAPPPAELSPGPPAAAAGPRASPR
ncbi:MAG: D-alanyl-D-alanine carboxypeptidase/D-alanyl-D-alanine-endopeptidase [Acidimicrobiales bacterium]